MTADLWDGTTIAGQVVQRIPAAEYTRPVHDVLVIETGDGSTYRVPEPRVST